MRASVVRRWLLGAGVAVVVLALGWAGLCYQVVQNPSVVTNPTPADAIVVLGPAYGARLDEALALADQGLSHVLIISNPTGNRQAERLCARPPTGWAVSCFDPDPGTTRGEAEHVRSLVSAHGWTNLIVVTSRYHISRARLIFGRCFTGRLQMVAAHEDISPAYWAYQYAYQSAGYVKAALHTDC